ncbi:MAG: zinc ABC transporter substrate-binding protein [Candidatus Vogelbacteria bacterium]|nr:zinc ABC transporter substrate-binding protein [Candidatus Vogelbacteria bacterium]
MKKFFLILVMLVVILLVVIILSSRRGLRSDDTNKLKITASFYPLYFFVQQVGGDKVSVKNFTPVGVEPHDYEPTARDMASIDDSKIVFLNGGGLESWSKNLKFELMESGPKVVTLGDGLIISQDPHIWLSPRLAIVMVTRIGNVLAEVDPANKSFYDDNTTKLLGQLNSLDAKYAAELANCKQQDIITSHAAFGYMAKDYHLTQVAIAGLSPDSEPSSKQLIEISKFASKNNIKYIFFESLVSPKLSDTIAEEVGAKTLVLNPIEGITAEEMAKGENYLTKMISNLNNLEIALQCNNQTVQ